MLTNGALTHATLNEGEVLLTLGDEKIVLKPTMGAWKSISTQFGGIAKARQALVDEHMQSVVNIIRIGANLSEKSVRKLEKLIFENGMNMILLGPVMRYLIILNNGGKAPPDMDIMFEETGDDGEEGMISIRQIESGDKDEGNY